MMNTHKSFLIIFAFLLMGTQYTLAEHRTDSLDQLKHEIAVGIGAPGIIPILGKVTISLAAVNPSLEERSSYSYSLPTFYGTVMSIGERC